MPQLKTQMREQYRGIRRALTLVEELFTSELADLQKGIYPPGVTVYEAAKEAAEIVLARWKVLERMKAVDIRLAELDREVGDVDLALPDTPGLIGPNGLPLTTKTEA